VKLHPHRKKIISTDNLYDLIIKAGISGVLGGRILHIISEHHLYDNVYDMLKIYNGGLSLLGSVISVTGYIIYVIYTKKLSFSAVVDLLSIYAPGLIGISRLGCFLAGCCYGCSTHVPWAIMYTHSQCLAPLYTYIHPTQLYSFTLLVLASVILHYLYHYLKKGQTFCISLAMISCERFLVDFVRGDRIDIGYTLSFHQLLALSVCILSLSGLIIIQYKAYNKNKERIRVS
jgi:phosphatidylglycerol:prolipoprotein diacylglycerol transferase